MGYLYSAVWFVVAIMLFVRFRKESVVVYILSGYFAFAGIWWLVDQFAEADMLNGIYGWVLRIVSVVMLVSVLAAYTIEKNLKDKKAQQVSAVEQGTDPELTEDPVSVG